MAHEEEFRIYMTAANRDQSIANDQHLSEAGIIAYYRGELPEAQRELMQAHLISCAKCITLFQSISDFLEPPGADEEDTTAAETSQEWQSFLQRVKIPTPESAAPVVQGDFKRSRDKKILSNSRVSLAIAASLLISIGAIGWSFWQQRQSRRQSQEMAALFERKQRELEQRLTQLTESNAEQVRTEREQRLAAEAERNKLQDLLAGVRPPVDEVKVYPFMLSAERGSAAELQLKLNTMAEVHLLISKPGAFSQYEIGIADESGKILRQFKNLRPRGVDRALSFRLNRGALNPGKYRLRLSAKQGTTSTQLGEYSLVVTGPSVSSVP